MKTKNIFKALALAMLIPAMLLTTACSSDDSIVNNEPTAKKGYPLQVTVNVTRQGDAATRAAYNESTKKLSFSSGDQLFVSGHDSSDGGAGHFAGALDYVDGSDGTFSGTITVENSSYSGDADALFTAAQASDYVRAILLPNGYGVYDYLYIDQNDGYNADVIPYAPNRVFALTKKLAVEQFIYEMANSYSSGTGFALSPLNAILNFTITGLTANKKVNVALGGALTIDKDVTTDGSGNATFAVGIYGGTDLNTLTLTVGGNAITLGTTNKTLEAGHIYNITRSVKSLANATAEDVGKVIGADYKIYANATLATAAKTTAVAVIAYMGSNTGEKSPRNHGLALALRDAGKCMWSASDNDANTTQQTSWTSFSPEGGMQYNAGRNSDDFPAFKAAMTYKACDSDINYWFLPSAYQWTQMINGAGGVDNLRNMANLLSAPYWTSSEYKYNMAWLVDTYEGIFDTDYKYHKYYVRACFAL